MADKGPDWASELGAPLEDIIAALNHNAKAAALLQKTGWTQQQLIEKGELIAKKLASDISDMSCV
jgi:hypothetical protein